jgi:predicted amidophosphoribosyltransferase
MKKVVIAIALHIFILSESAFAVCCACAGQLAAIENSFNALASATISTTSMQVQENKAIDGVKRRAMMMLEYDRQRSEIISQAKLIDSAGFASTINRFRSEKVGSESVLSESMREGYDISDKDAEDITESAF